jgi:hypothetical protein
MNHVGLGEIVWRILFHVVFEDDWPIAIERSVPAF